MVHPRSPEKLRARAGDDVHSPKEERDTTNRQTTHMRRKIHFSGFMTKPPGVTVVLISCDHCPSGMRNSALLRNIKKPQENIQKRASEIQRREKRLEIEGQPQQQSRETSVEESQSPSPIIPRVKRCSQSRAHSDRDQSDVVYPVCW